jgi:hypothetical protein
VATESDIDPHLMAIVEMFQLSAFTSLGKLIDPTTGKAEVNLQGARFAIDTLEMLERKTSGNLTDAERRHLTAALDTLRLNYLEETKAASATSAPGSATDAPTQAAPDSESGATAGAPSTENKSGDGEKIPAPDVAPGESAASAKEGGEPS